ncbi:MAG TPA: hypothetical protein VM165_07200 [Planctomycetaceae bacterium]|nr:hypothetical protein [Planctomycetaceae bacterium]
MSDLQLIRDMIELDVFLFGGVPELPDPIFGRDFLDYSQSRLTRSGVEDGSHSHKPLKLKPEHILQKVIIDFQTGTIRSTPTAQS